MLRQMPGSEGRAYQSPVNGRVQCRSVGQNDRGKAERGIPRLQRLARERCDEPEESPNLSNAMAEEVDRLEVDVSPRQAERVRCGLANFLKYAGDLPLEHVTPQMVEDYQRKRLREVSRETSNKEITYLLRLLRRNGFMIPKPSPKPGRMTEQRAFTPDELERFFSACPKRLRTLYTLMLVTGARQAELVPSSRSNHTALLKSEVDFEHRRITIRSAKNLPFTRGKVRVLEIPEDIVGMLRRQIEEMDGSHVFRPMHNSPRDFNQVLEAAGIPKIDALGRKATSHSFRHTYATLMAESVGHNPFLLKEILGHKKISTTERYCHPTAPALSLNMRQIGAIQ